ncbi:hypothetical protein [Microbacterium sp. NPDC089695]|uniref:hypothetical protein n=1 Tax=Microbacterium sp. NPDC089695 TaxID=3364198 RepID=UPI0037FD7F64
MAADELDLAYELERARTMIARQLDDIDTEFALTVDSDRGVTDDGGWLTLHGRAGKTHVEFSRVVIPQDPDPDEPSLESNLMFFLSAFEEHLALLERPLRAGDLVL